MFSIELRFAAKPCTERDAQTDAIEWYVAALQRNGNLLSGSLVATEDHGWVVYAAAPARDAFKRASQNEFVRKRLSMLKAASVGRPLVRFLSSTPDTAPDCRCSAPQALFLFTTFLHSEPPVRCLECNGVVPLYRLPTPENGEYSALLSWEANYKACDTLQMNSTVGVRFGERQMSTLTSTLSLSGLAVCREIEERTVRPVYYYLYRPSARSRSAEMRRRCPNCGRRWRLREPLHGKFDFKCDACRLLSNIAWTVR